MLPAAVNGIAKLPTTVGPMRARVLIVSAVAAAAALTPAAPASALTNGVQIANLSKGQSPAYLRQQLDAAKDLGADLVRTEVTWAALEPDASGRRDPAYLALLDGFMADTKSRGLRVLFTFEGTPCWASSAPDDIRSACDARAQTWPPTDPHDYAEAAGFLAARYGARLTAIEIWNEPDHQNEFYFAGPDKPTRYAAILKAAYPAIKAASPQTQVLAGSLVGANGAFLSALYAAGIKGSYDALSVHYYDIVLGSLRTIRQVMKAHGDSSPVWLSEFGWTSCSPQRTQGGHACVSKVEEGRSLQDIYASLKHTSWVDAAITYNMADFTQYDFGLIDVHGNRKPAFAALQRVFMGHGPPVRSVKLRLRRSGGRLVASGSGPAGDDLELDAFRGGRQLYKAVFRLDRRSRYSLRLPGQLGTSGLRVRVYQYWTGRSASATA